MLLYYKKKHKDGKKYEDIKKYEDKNAQKEI
jgi:hypothetical protein